MVIVVGGGGRGAAEVIMSIMFIAIFTFITVVVADVLVFYRGSGAAHKRSSALRSALLGAFLRHECISEAQGNPPERSERGRRHESSFLLHLLRSGPRPLAIAAHSPLAETAHGLSGTNSFPAQYSKRLRQTLLDGLRFSLLHFSFSSFAFCPVLLLLFWLLLLAHPPPRPLFSLRCHLSSMPSLRTSPLLSAELKKGGARYPGREGTGTRL